MKFKEYLNEKINIDYSKYENSHGKKPSNTIRGAWIFSYGKDYDNKDNWIFTKNNLTLKEAIKEATKQIKEKNIKTTYLIVMP